MDLNGHWKRYCTLNNALYGLHFLKVDCGWKKFYRKNVDNFSERKAKNFAWKFLTVSEKSLKTEMISLSYDVIDNVYSKSKSVQFRTDLANIKVIRILTLS